MPLSRTTSAFGASRGQNMAGQSALENLRQQDKYDLHRLGCELLATANGTDYHGQALHAAQALAGLEDHERILLERWASRIHQTSDRAALRRLALRMQEAASRGEALDGSTCAVTSKGGADTKAKAAARAGTKNVKKNVKKKDAEKRDVGQGVAA